MTKDLPIVTAIITTYNRANFIGRAIESVLAQTYGDFELIIVDDGSSDNTGEIVKGFRDQCIKYIRHDKNLGGQAARNTGIREAKGRYISFLDDDDQWLSTKIEKQVQRMEQCSLNVGLIYVGAEIIDKDGNVIEYQYPKIRGDVQYNLLLGSFFGSVTKALIKKECFDKVGLFDESLKSCQDWDMWKRISDFYEFDFVPEILAKIHLHGTQISSNYASLIPGRTRMVEKYEKDFIKYPKIYVIHLKRLGKLHCINGTWKLAFYWYKKVLEINKFEIIKILAWCFIEFPFLKIKNFKRFESKNNINENTSD